jgi:hypothetical protein
MATVADGKKYKFEMRFESRKNIEARFGGQLLAEVS